MPPETGLTFKGYFIYEEDINLLMGYWISRFSNSTHKNKSLYPAF